MTLGLREGEEEDEEEEEMKEVRGEFVIVFEILSLALDTVISLIAALCIITFVRLDLEFGGNVLRRACLQ